MSRAQSLSPDQPVSPRDMAGAQVGRVWMEADPQARAGRAGTVVFRFGESLPVLICAPLRICSIGFPFKFAEQT